MQMLPQAGAMEAPTAGAAASAVVETKQADVRKHLRHVKQHEKSDVNMLIS